MGGYRHTVTPKQALAFVERHGVVLEGARGPVPSLAEAIAGGSIRGSWWGHPKGNEIFNVTRAVRDSGDILTCRLILQKITFVHRRLWPAVVRMASHLGRAKLAAIRERHTRGGAHEIVTTPYPQWVPKKTHSAADSLTEEDALSQLGDWVTP